MPEGDFTPLQDMRKGLSGPLRVLFVDDDPLVLNSLKRALFRDFQVDVAASGQEALNLFRAAAVHAVVIADQQMPGMTGIEFLSRLREVSPDTVRIMLTGQADLPTAIQAVNRGEVFRFLTKPVDIPALKSAVKDAIQLFIQKADERKLLAEAYGKAPASGQDDSVLRQLLEAKLTHREQEVLRLIGQGGSSKDIGPRLGISHRTVDVHRSHILEKLGLHNAQSLVHVAIKAGLV